MALVTDTHHKDKRIRSEYGWISWGEWCSREKKRMGDVKIKKLGDCRCLVEKKGAEV